MEDGNRNIQLLSSHSSSLSPFTKLGTQMKGLQEEGFGSN